MNPPLRPRDRPVGREGPPGLERGALVVGLLPARTDTAWFHEPRLPGRNRNPVFKGTLEV